MAVPQPTHLLQVDNVSKYFGNVVALKDVSAFVNAGEVTCILGDNGAGKSSLIKILSGVHQADEGRVVVDGDEVRFDSPRDARAKGIATVYQDLAMVSLMSIWRNFFLGAEPTAGVGPMRRFDIAFARRTVREQLHEMGIEIRDPDQPVGTLSGGNVSRLRSRGRSTSVPVCSSWTSRRRRSASSRPASCSVTSSRPGTRAWR